MATATEKLRVAIPIRSFSGSKSRLAAALSAPQREELMRDLAAGVITALARLSVVVVTTDAAVIDWASAHSLDVLQPRSPGLNMAASAALAEAAQSGFERLAIVHADLAEPSTLSDVFRTTQPAGTSHPVTIVPDRREDGTNVLVVPTTHSFEFRYGPGSFIAHSVEAERLGLTCQVIRQSPLGWDVDTPEDLAALAAGAGPNDPSHQAI
jgi:2-phospho-L-lactate guanylyltransferase